MYAPGPYTFTARPGTKFVIAAFEYTNTSRDPVVPSSLDADALRAADGTTATAWHAEGGIHNAAYRPRLSTAAEVSLLEVWTTRYETDTNGQLKMAPDHTVVLARIAPGQSVTDSVTFEVEASARPQSMRLSSVPVPVVLDPAAVPSASPAGTIAVVPSPAVRAQAARTTPTPTDIEIISWHTERDINDTLYLIGEIRNNAALPLAPVMQAVSRDASGAVVDSEDWHPASTGTVPPGSTWPLKFPISSKPNVANVDLRVIRVSTR